MEMVYEKRHYGTRLAEGTCRGYQYIVVSYGSHPCCYIRLMESDKFYNSEYDDIPLNCHGGLTYKSSNGLQGKPGTWIGWDYAHWGDYVYLGPGFNSLASDEKRWTTDELVADCKRACRHLYNLNHERKNE